MNIAIIGPEKFAFQDMVCIELALAYRHTGKVELVPEPKGGEDANFVWSDQTPLTLEVQVKGAKGSAGVAELADYLIHYPDRKTDGSLAERLFDSNDQHALFVLTARCNDDISLLLTPTGHSRPTTRSVPPLLAEKLRDEFVRIGKAALSKKATKLELERRKNVVTLAKRPVSDFERLLKKTTISDQQTSETVEIRLHAAMRSFRFDTLSIRGILAGLSDVLVNCKRTQLDALAPMLEELSSYAPSAIQPEGYVSRDDESNLLTELSRECLLLLAGPPRVGKSWTARNICGVLQTEGYETGQGGYIEEAERFLLDPTGAERVYFLDDPLGSREPVHDAISRVAALKGLTDRIPSNRRLIVAQTEQVLLQVCAGQSLDACALGAHHWHRLESLSIENAKSVWEAAAATQELTEGAIVKVIELIERQPSMRDPGALVFLAQTWRQLALQATDEAILMQSRSDAKVFAQKLAEQTPAMRDILTASAIATTASEGSSNSDLAFIIDGSEERPSLKDIYTVTMHETQQEDPPTYANVPAISTDQKLALDTLMRRRVIENRPDRIIFTHPYLRAGAQALVVPDIVEDSERILNQVERAISCCSPVTSLATARNFPWLQHALHSQNSNTIYDAARLGIRSVFPATRDCCFEFLIASADQLPREYLEELPSWSEQILHDLSDITVVNGIGFIPRARSWAVGFSESASLDEIKPYLDAIEAQEPLALDLALSRRMLLTLEKHPSALTHTTVRRFLSADEAVVRASAAGLWFQIQRKDDDDIIERLTADTTPAISIKLLRVLASSWEALDETRREKILDILHQHATSPGCASVLLNRLVLFDRVEHFGEEPPWRIYTELMPVVIRHLPLSVSFKDGRFDSTINAALVGADKGAVKPAIEAWAERLFQRLDHHMLDEFELAIVDPLLDGVDLASRLPILEKLLDVSDTGAKSLTVKWLAKRWDELNTSERTLLRQAIQKERPDKTWLSSAILTLASPPKELVFTITDDENTLTYDVDVIEQRLGEELFAACVRMYVGSPQPLYWYATHHSGNTKWESVIRYLAQKPEHALHSIGLYEIVDSGEQGELAALIEALPEGELSRAFDRLLEFKIANVGSWRSDAWQCLLVRGEAAGLLNDFIKKIDAVLEGVLESCADIRHWIGEGSNADRILDLLPEDIRAYDRINNLQRIHKAMQEAEASNEQITEDLLRPLITELCNKELFEIEENPPRIMGTWNIISKVFKTLGADAKTLAQIKTLRLKAISRHSAIRKSARGEPPKTVLTGWVFQNEQNQ